MILADKIVNLRKRAGWSQEELAEKMGGQPPVNIKVGRCTISS